MIKIISNFFKIENFIYNYIILWFETYLLEFQYKNIFNWEIRNIGWLSAIYRCIKIENVW
jgi:hypothetical protein